MKTNAQRFYNASVSLLLLLSFLLCSFSKSQAQHLIPDQDPAFPLYTRLDTNALKKYEAALDFETFNLKLVHELRTVLKPALANEDPLAYWLYAKSMDLYPYGHGNPKEAAIALEYYTKAADKGLARAEHFLFTLYRYGLMESGPDLKKALSYLQRAMQHGYDEGKAQCYLAMATLYGGSESRDLVQPSSDSALFYLEKALALTPNDTWALDFAAGIYEEKGNYAKAIQYRLRSDNDQSHIEVARWYMEGKYVKKDVNRALEIMYNSIERLRKHFGDDLGGYMGSSNPLHVLNDWYLCKKWITREQLGKYYNKNWMCEF